MAKVFEAKNIRNVVVLGHQSSGKTSLTEGLAFVSGGIGVRVRKINLTIVASDNILCSG